MTKAQHTVKLSIDWWTAHHLKSKTAATIITSRNSGASYRNRVEFQNGCLALAHATLFIPSTLNGSCISDSGKIDQIKLQENLSSAIDVYVNRVDAAPCASTEIHVYRGADSQEYQNENTLVKMYLKGSKEVKENFKKENPKMNERINRILHLQARHHCKDIPSKYIFYFRCCYEAAYIRVVSKVALKQSLLGIQVVHPSLLCHFHLWILNVRLGKMPVLIVNHNVLDTS